MIVVIEGLDAAGKTTACDLLESLFGAIKRQTPPKSYLKLRDEVDLKADAESHYRFYLGGVQETSVELRSFSSSDLIALDRYWMTTIAYHRAMGVNARLEDFGDLVVPDAIVYLEVSEAVQKARLNIRGMGIGDRRAMPIMPMVRLEYECILGNLAKVIRINTDLLSPEEVVQKIIANLQLR